MLRLQGACALDVLRHRDPEYFFDDRQHHVPHIHAQYATDEAVFAIESGEVIAGGLPAGKARLVQAWIEIHRAELRANWELAVKGEEVFKIDPLK